MDFFTKAGTSVRRGAALLGVSASTSFRKLKLKVHADTVTGEAEKLKSALADKAYQIWKSGGDFASLEEDFAQLDEKYMQIQDLEKQMKDLNYEENEIFGWDKNEAAEAETAAAETEASTEAESMEAAAAEETAVTQTEEAAEEQTAAPEAAAVSEISSESEPDTGDAIPADALREAVEAAVLEAESEGAIEPDGE